MSTGDEFFRDRWGKLIARLGLKSSAVSELDILLKLYGEPARHYHNLEHIRGCLIELDQMVPAPPSKDAIEAATWFHDAVYDPKAADNEERSAELAIYAFGKAGASSEFLKTIEELILATKHSQIPTIIIGQTMVDIDLSILGKPPAEFDRYERAIRLEYQHVPDEAFRKGRTAILEKFLSRERIFLTEFFQKKYEDAARRNIARSIRRLATAVPLE